MIQGHCWQFPRAINVSGCYRDTAPLPIDHLVHASAFRLRPPGYKDSSPKPASKPVSFSRSYFTKELFLVQAASVPSGNFSGSSIPSSYALRANRFLASGSGYCTPGQQR